MNLSIREQQEQEPDASVKTPLKRADVYYRGDDEHGNSTVEIKLLFSGYKLFSLYLQLNQLKQLSTGQYDGLVYDGNSVRFVC